MKRNIFITWLVLAGLLFAAVTLGGCGGSGGGVQEGYNPDSGNGGGGQMTPT